MNMELSFILSDVHLPDAESLGRHVQIRRTEHASAPIPILVDYGHAIRIYSSANSVTREMTFQPIRRNTRHDGLQHAQG